MCREQLKFLVADSFQDLENTKLRIHPHCNYEGKLQLSTVIILLPLIANCQGPIAYKKNNCSLPVHEYIPVKKNPVFLGSLKKKVHAVHVPMHMV